MYGGSGMNLFAQKPVICHMVGVIGSMSFEGTWHYADHSASWPFSYTVEVKEDGLHLSDGASVVDALTLQASEKDGVLTGVGESKYGPYSVVGSRAANGLKLREFRLVDAPACAPSLFDGSRACTMARHHGMPAATSCRLGKPPAKKRGSAALAVAQIPVSTWAPVSPAVTGVAPVPDCRASVHSPGALPLAKPDVAQQACKSAKDVSLTGPSGCVCRSVNAAEAWRCGLAAHCVASYACATPARGCGEAHAPRRGGRGTSSYRDGKRQQHSDSRREA